MDKAHSESQSDNATSNVSGQAAEQQAWIDRSLSVNAGAAVIVEALGIGQVKNLRAELLARLQQRDAISIDLSKTDTVDAAGLQLLVAFHQEAMKRGLQVKIAGAYESVKQSLSLLGLQFETAAN
jgi:anti-anti-sigma regulatory factor